MSRYRPDSSLRVIGPQLVLGGSPLRLFKLTEAGRRMLDAIIGGTDIASNRLVDRLVDAGALHPQPDPIEALPEVTVVVPVFAPAGRTITVPSLPFPMIVVDDASPGTLNAPSGAVVVRRETNGGPGAARMTGVEAVTTPFVAFVDTDVDLPDDWWERLASHFTDDHVVAVAPRVRSAQRSGSLARYERVRSPLDLGPEPARVRARTRVSYVPSAVLVVRIDAMRACGGFDPALRTGEDVDLVWRLDEVGGKVRYEPQVEATHEPRPSLAAFVQQRRGYGRSAAPLARRHDGALTPVGVSGWSAAVWLSLVLGWPVASLALVGGTALALLRKLPDLPRKVVVDLVGHGHLGAGRQLASAVTRVWWPLLLPFVPFSKRVRWVLVASFVMPALLDWRRGDAEGPPMASYVGLRVLDDVAYGIGVWEGILRERTLAPAIPDLTSWPQSGRYEQRRTDR